MIEKGVVGYINVTGVMGRDVIGRREEAREEYQRRRVRNIRDIERGVLEM